MRKPDTIMFGTEERPPLRVVLGLATQHALVLSIFLVSPTIVARAAQVPLEQAVNFLSITMIALAGSTLLQVRRWGPVGSGLLVVPTSSSNWVPACVIAAREGGMAAVSGLLLVAAFVEIVLSRFLRWLRGLLPTELAGLVVLVTGLGVAQAGMDNLVAGITAGGGTHWMSALLVSLVTLVMMIGFTVWGRGPVSALGASLGLIGGYVASIAAGLVDRATLDGLEHLPLFRIPHPVLSRPSFDLSLLLPAVITGAVTSLNSIGALTAAQRLNDADWHRQDLPGIARGLLADGLGTIGSALSGGAGVAASATSVRPCGRI